MKIALVGNQNCGKTTLFNALTGEDQHVGNWPGVTVEQKTGVIKGNENMQLIDLPGVYSLNAFTLEERITRDYLIGEKPDAILNVVDASCLKRGLYLTMQLLELHIPMIVALNMMDVVRRRGAHIDIQRLSELLGVPVVPVSARGGEGVAQIMKSIDQARAGRLEAPGNDFRQAAAERYRRIDHMTAACFREPRNGATNREMRADHWLLNRLLAYPMFIAVMAVIFGMAFGTPGRSAATAFSRLLSVGIKLLDGWLESLHAAGWLRLLVTEGVLAGIASVLSFLPVLLILFLCLSILENSGYMARAALLMDRPMRYAGLSGQSFFALLMGFGCTVPAVLAARGMREEGERKTLVYMLPFLSCGAKLPVYMLLLEHSADVAAGWVIGALYLLGLLLGLLTVSLNRLAGGRAAASFMLELPAYHLPTVRGVARLIGEKTGDFIRRAFTLIFLASLVIAVLQHLTPQGRLTDSLPESLLGVISQAAVPLFEPLGFGSREAVCGLMAGLLAKESIISTLSVMTGDRGIASVFPETRALLSYLVFLLLYTPCVSALAAVRRELGGREAVGMAVRQFAIGWAAALVLYRICNLF